MKLYWCPQTRAARAVWLLEEADISYQLIEVDIRDPQAKANAEADFYAASPMGKVPAIVDGKVKLADSAAIGMYVADKYASGRLAPGIDDDNRGKYLYWMLFTPGVLEPCMAEKASGWKPNPLSHGWGEFDSMIKTLEQGLQQGPWLLGDWFTAADILVGSSVVFLQMFKMLPESPVLNAYAERCLARPAYQKAMQMG